MLTTKVVSRAEWLSARSALLAKEKEFTRLRDDLSRQRRNLPRVRIDKEYVFDTPRGKATLADLFEGRSQLAVYHFMFGPDDDQGCKSCSFWADSFDGIVTHLRSRDVTMVVVSRAPSPKLEAFKRRMGWSFTWASSCGNDFNRDFHVLGAPEDIAKGEVFYNYETREAFAADMPGFSAFVKDELGAVHHTYSTYARGLDMLNTAYNILDLMPKGRDEDALENPMSWVRHRDRYDVAPAGTMGG